MKKLVNYKDFYRRALATPGLLKITSAFSIYSMLTQVLTNWYFAPLQNKIILKNAFALKASYGLGATH